MEAKRLLVADDDPVVRSLLRYLLSAEGYVIAEAKTGSEVLAALSDRFDLVLMDVRMPDLGGMEVLQRLKEQGRDVGVLLMTAFGSSNLASRAIQLGAYDYIAKPFELEDVLLTVRRYFELQALTAEVKDLRTRVASRDPAERMVGQSQKMLDVYKTVGLVAQSDTTVLITGDTGTGKELVAEIIHQNSTYRAGPLIKVGCASLPETLLESELFGHEKGAFTSAVVQRKGRFELAHKGTIFLDEIGEMSLGTQKKLLRVLQEHEFERVGGSTPIRVDCRVIAATNRNLADEVGSGRFREDLYYRLNVIAIHMPPLRDRPDDLPLLVEHFLDKHRLTPTSPPAKISEEAMVALERHDWPGNVRELENTISRSVVLSQGGIITSRHLFISAGPNEAAALRRAVDIASILDRGTPLAEATSNFEKQIIIEALRRSQGVEAEAAALLRTDVSELLAKIKRYGISSGRQFAA
jgi:two-component system, NtrC family, response regulator AtoC